MPGSSSEDQLDAAALSGEQASRTDNLHGGVSARGSVSEGRARRGASHSSGRAATSPPRDTCSVYRKQVRG